MGALHPAAFLAMAALLGAALPQDGEGWIALPLPSLARPSDPAPTLERLEAGSHLLLPGEGSARAEARPSPSLPLPALVGLLQEELSRRQLPGRFHTGGPPLLARAGGESAALLRRVLVELDAAGRAQEVELAAWLVEGASPAAPRPSRADFEREVGSRAPWGTARARSGAEVAFGERRERTYVAEYDVEVATDSGVADPRIGRIATGRTLNLRACRVAGGRAVHLEGLLDMAELLRIEDFDTGTSDLGVVQRPRVASLQVAFSGVVESGGLLSVSIEGAGLGEPDWTLWLEARTELDPGAADGGGPSWRALDLALVEGRGIELPLPRPGTGLSLGPQAQARLVLSESLASSAVAQAADQARGSTRGPRPALVWSSALLLAPAAERELWAEIEGLVAAAEAARSSLADLAVEHGALRVRLPTAEGVPARVLAVIEEPLLVDYDVEVAQESWMAAPRVEVARDGLALQGHLTEGALTLTAWIATSSAPGDLSRADVGVGRMQLSDRTLRARSATFPLDGRPRELLSAAAGAPGLSVVAAGR